MTYATLETIIELQPKETLLQLVDDDNDGDFIADPPNKAYQIIQAAIGDAQSIVNSYISGRYRLPLNIRPPIIVQIASNLALCALYDRRRELDQPKGIKERRERAMKQLEDIQAQKASIPELSDIAPSSVVISSPPKTFSHSMLSRM
ncbi:MAG: DUF1320 domain-containing protein [Chitinispirillia bacterium]|nr:DUF1320 domain-containing protein [Chitinispirillia bacterium]